jgi:hypothetical protein
MALVSEKPQLGVAIFQRIPRRRKYGMLTARVARPLEEIDEVMRNIQKKTGIYGWTLVPHEGFFEIVLCANREQLDTAKKQMQKRWRHDVKMKRYGGKLHYIGHDNDRTKAAKKYISHIRRIAGREAGKFLNLVAHNVPAEVFSELAVEKRRQRNG